MSTENFDIRINDKGNATKSTDKLQKGLRGVDSAAGKAAKAFGKIMVALVAVTAAFVVFKKIGQQFSAGAKDVDILDQSMGQLRAVLKSTHSAAGLTANQVVKLSNDMADLSRFTDTEILSANNLLLTFKEIGKDIFPLASQAIIDMAAAMKTDLKSATLMIGKALNDPILGVTALSRAGVQFTQQQKDMIKTMVESGNVVGAQAIIMKELNSQFSGSALAAIKNFGGQTKLLTEKFEDTRRAIVKIVTDALTPFLEKINAMGAKVRAFFTVDRIVEYSAKFYELFGYFQAVAKVLFEKLAPGFKVSEEGASSFATNALDGVLKFAKEAIIGVANFAEYANIAWVSIKFGAIDAFWIIQTKWGQLLIGMLEKISNSKVLQVMLGLTGDAISKQMELISKGQANLNKLRTESENEFKDVMKSSTKVMAENREEWTKRFDEVKKGTDVYLSNKKAIIENDNQLQNLSTTLKEKVFPAKQSAIEANEKELGLIGMINAKIKELTELRLASMDPAQIQAYTAMIEEEQAKLNELLTIQQQTVTDLGAEFSSSLENQLATATTFAGGIQGIFSTMTAVIRKELAKQFLDHVKNSAKTNAVNAIEAGTSTTKWWAKINPIIAVGMGLAVIAAVQAMAKKHHTGYFPQSFDQPGEHVAVVKNNEPILTPQQVQNLAQGGGQRQSNSLTLVAGDDFSQSFMEMFREMLVRGAISGDLPIQIKGAV